jgi:hypothetical protein
VGRTVFRQKNEILESFEINSTILFLNLSRRTFVLVFCLRGTLLVDILYNIVTILLLHAVSLTFHRELLSHFSFIYLLKTLHIPR